MPHKITKKEWAVYRYLVQEKKGYVDTAELLGLDINQVKATIKRLRKYQPEIFGISPTDDSKLQESQTNGNRWRKTEPFNERVHSEGREQW